MALSASFRHTEAFPSPPRGGELSSFALDLSTPSDVLDPRARVTDRTKTRARAKPTNLSAFASASAPRPRTGGAAALTTAPSAMGDPPGGGPSRRRPHRVTRAATRALEARASAVDEREDGTHAPARPSDEATSPGREPGGETERRADTPRPAATRPAAKLVDGRLYRGPDGTLRAASAEVARRLDVVPPLPGARDPQEREEAMPPPAPAPMVRHGAAASDGTRGDTRVAKLSDENCARVIDVMRLWAGVNAKAQSATRLPWSDAFKFVAERNAWTTPAPKSSEQVKDRIRTIARATATRKGEGDPFDQSPLGVIAFWGGETHEPLEWMGTLAAHAFPFERPRASVSKRRAKRARTEEETPDDDNVATALNFDDQGGDAPSTSTEERAERASRTSDASCRRAPANREAPPPPRRAREVTRERAATTQATAPVPEKDWRREEEKHARAGNTQGALEAKAARLGLSEFVKTCERPTTAIKLLEEGGAQWPAAAQYLPKKDVGALIALFRTLTPWLLNHPDDVAAVAEMTERAIDYKFGAIAPRLDFVSRWVVGFAESPLRSLM